MSEPVDYEAALAAKKYPAPLAYDQSIWNAAINEAIEVVRALRLLPTGAAGERVTAEQVRQALVLADTDSKEGQTFREQLADALNAVRTTPAREPVACAWCNPRIEHQWSCPEHPPGESEAFEARHEERELAGDLALEGFIDWCDLEPDAQNALAATLAREYLALRRERGR